jgi:RNA polymerase sigma-70 factor (ECF subfamily)
MTLQTDSSHDESITQLLVRVRAGDNIAEALVVNRVYPELRRIAGRFMRNERTPHTLQPTALVNEAYLRLAGEADIAWQNKAHFLALAALSMRQILVDHARSRAAKKRGGNQNQITLSEPLLGNSPPIFDVLFIHEAIEQLTALDARQAHIVELHFFGGLSFEEIASVLGISARTVKRDWSMARAWLRTRLAPPP